MDSRFNFMAMAALGAGVVALGATLVTGEVFKGHRPEKMGYVVEGVEEPGEAGAAAEVPIENLLATADVAKGADVFKKCASCHTNTQGGANGIGPNLWGIMGKPHAGVAGFAYSDALKSKPGNWSWTEMSEWLRKPNGYAPGTKMSFAGLSKGEDRANLLAYLNTLGSNLPLPTPKAEAAAPATADANAPAGEAAMAQANASAATPADTKAPASATAETAKDAPGGKGPAPTQ